MKGLPDYVDGPLGCFELGAHGRIEVSGDAERLELNVQSGTTRVFDVWVKSEGQWCQLNRVDEDVWGNPDLRSLSEVRLWLARTEAPAVVQMAEQQPEQLEAYVPVVEGAPPLPEERTDTRIPSRLKHWIHVRTDETVVQSMLEAWNVACARATAEGWMPNLPTGEDLLPVFARSAPPGALDVDQAFGRWLAFEVGRASKRGVGARQDLELRREAVRGVHTAMADVIRAICPEFQVIGNPPGVIGPIDRHRWLVDEAFAERVGNPAGSAPHRPVFVVRPLLLLGEEVFCEGEVA